MDKNKIIINPENSEEPKNFSHGYLTIPFEGDLLKEFISKLLSMPQSLSKVIEGTFEIQLKDLQNFYNLISQRVEQQNSGILIQFRTKIYFSDGSAVLLSSYPELLSYNEVKPVRSIAARLTWDYLIHFNDRNTPEKQTIDLTIIAGGDNKTKYTHKDFTYLYYSIGEFRIDINHTARSWAYDMESLLTNQINSILKEENRFKKIIRKKSTQISLIGLSIYLIGAMIGSFLVTKFFILQQVDHVKLFINKQNITIDQKINFLITQNANGNGAQHLFLVLIFLLISIILSIGFAVILEHYADNASPSFIILTRESKKYRDRVIMKYERKWNLFFCSIFIGLIVDILASYIFYLFTN